MRLPVILPAFVCILFASSFVFAHDVQVDYDHSANFSKYRTFTWVQKPEMANPITADRIVKDVNAQLTAKGLRLVSSGADLYVTASMSIEQLPIYNTFYSGGGWGWGWGGGWATTYVDTYLTGTTVVELFDPSREKTVWRATATGGVSHKPEKVSRKQAKVIGEMFEKYPPALVPISD